MRNACIVVKMNKNSLFQTEIGGITDVFSKNGYAFDEIRTLVFQHDWLAEILQVAEKNYENVLLLCEKSLFSAIEEILSSLGGEFLKGAISAGVYFKRKFSLFLISLEEKEDGAEFVWRACIPHLVKKYGTRFDRMIIRAIGAPVGKAEELISTAKRISGGDLAYNHIRSYDEDVIEIFYGANVSRMLTDDVLRLFADGLQEYIYALDDKTIEEQLLEILKLRGKKLSVAESFTGGGVGRRIVSVSGASEVYFEGLNTYNELSKMKRLGVREYTLKSFGAVSDETVYEMAAGLIAAGDADISIATTGLAGPKSDRTELPVGLSFIAIGTKEKVHVYRFKFEGTRKEITEKAINHALFLAYRQLKDI